MIVDSGEESTEWQFEITQRFRLEKQRSMKRFAFALTAAGTGFLRPLGTKTFIPTLKVLLSMPKERQQWTGHGILVITHHKSAIFRI
jgi:hypothetical protein